MGRVEIAQLIMAVMGVAVNVANVRCALATHFAVIRCGTLIVPIPPLRYAIAMSLQRLVPNQLPLRLRPVSRRLHRRRRSQLNRRMGSVICLIRHVPMEVVATAIT